MAIRDIRLFGDPILATAADPVTDFDKQLRNLVNDLTQTLDDAQGAGLAAPQIGVGLRVFAYAVGDERGHLVNPVLDFPDAEEQDGDEGCLSFPGIYYDVKRRLNTVARGFTDRGRPDPGRRNASPRPLPAARDRPPGRRAVHRPHGRGHQEASYEGNQRCELGRAGQDQPAPDD